MWFLVCVSEHSIPKPDERPVCHYKLIRATHLKEFDASRSRTIRMEIIAREKGRVTNLCLQVLSFIPAGLGCPLQLLFYSALLSYWMPVLCFLLDITIFKSTQWGWEQTQLVYRLNFSRNDDKHIISVLKVKQKSCVRYIFHLVKHLQSCGLPLFTFCVDSWSSSVGVLVLKKCRIYIVII